MILDMRHVREALKAKRSDGPVGLNIGQPPECEWVEAFEGDPAVDGQWFIVRARWDAEKRPYWESPSGVTWDPTFFKGWRRFYGQAEGEEPCECTKDT